TILCQPAIFCLEYALTKLWESFGVTPDVVLGHSVGEFAASVCAGILSLQDALQLVSRRSELVYEQEAGSMMVVRASEEKTKNLIKTFEGPIDIAAVNSPEEIVVSGKVAPV